VTLTTTSSNLLLGNDHLARGSVIGICNRMIQNANRSHNLRQKGKDTEKNVTLQGQRGNSTQHDSFQTASYWNIGRIIVCATSTRARTLSPVHYHRTLSPGWQMFHIFSNLYPTIP